MKRSPRDATNVDGGNTRSELVHDDDSTDDWSDPATLLRCVTEGCPHEGWEHLSRETHEIDLKRARQLIAVVVDACHAGHRKVLDRLDSAVALLAGTDVVGEERLRSYVDKVGALADLARGRDRSFTTPRDVLATIDPRFGELEPGDVIDVLRKQKGKRRARIGPRRMAAELMVKAGAFGFRRNPGEDIQVTTGRAKDVIARAHRGRM